MLRTTASRVANLVRKAVCPPILVGARTSTPPLKARLVLELCEAREVPATLTVTSLGDLTEGGGAGGFRVTRDGDTAQALYVLVAAPGGTATAGTDYTGLAAFPSYLPIPAGASYADIYLTPVDDAAVEGTETISISVAEYSVAGPSGWVSGTISLFDNDTAPIVTVEKVADATEGGVSGTFRYTRDGDVSGYATIFVSYSGGSTATPGSDYGALSSQVLFAPGVATVDVAVAPVDDGVSEPTEVIVATIFSGGGMTIGSPGAASMSLFDNDPQVVTVMKVLDAAEGENAKFRFARIGDLSNSLVVNYSSSGGTATSGTDFTTLPGTVTFAAGASNADVSVATIDDNIYDPDETIVVTVTSGSSYTIGSEDVAEIVIADSAQLVFTLATYSGSIKYDIPWDNVDPGEASQSLALTNFVINIDGLTFTSSSTNVTFVTAPTALFLSGDFKGITFDIDTTLVGGGFAFASVAAGFDINGDNIISAIQA